MRCILIDDEPLARKAIQKLITGFPGLELLSSFGDAVSAAEYLRENTVDLIFLDIRMPEIDGLEFARTVGPQTLIIFTTAYSEYALDSYQVDAIDYLVKPVEKERFGKAVEKALNYYTLLRNNAGHNSIESVSKDFMYVKSDRRYFKIRFSDIRFIEGLKDYAIIQTDIRRIITHMNLKTINDLLPHEIFIRVNKSYIMNMDYVESFDNNDIYSGSYIIPIGSSYRDAVFNTLMSGN